MPARFCVSRRKHRASTRQNGQSSKQLRTQIPTIVVLDERPTDRRARKCRNADPKKDESNPYTRLPVISREPPDNRVIQPLHGTGEEPVEAGDDGNGGVARSADPDEEEDGGEED